MKNEIKIVIADDHEIFRSGLKFILDQHDKFKVIGEARNGKELLSLLTKMKPDIILLDIEMPEMNGIEASERILPIYPNLKIIVLSNYDDEEYYSSIIVAGAKGFVLKKAGINELESAILSVNEGNSYFSQELLQKLVAKRMKSQKKPTKMKNQLTQREQEILELISEGLSNHLISEKLFISPRTVNNHRAKLLAKTNTNNTASLIMFAIKNQLLVVHTD